MSRFLAANPYAGGQPSGASPTPVSAPRPSPTGGPQPMGVSSPLKFTVSRAGQTETVDGNVIADALTQQGMNVQGFTPDGLKVRVSQANGMIQEIPVGAAMAQTGWELSKMVPTQASNEFVSPQARAAISNLPDDNTRKMYLEKRLQSQGMEGTIYGEGDDWYMLDGQGKHHALTNTQAWDTADLAEFIPNATRAIGGVGGALLGSMTATPGVGTVVGGTAGATAANLMNKSVLAAFDPALAETMGENFGGVAKDVATDAALDAGFGTLGYAVPTAAKQGLARFANIGTKTGPYAASGLGSKVAQGVGGAVEGLGSATAGVGKVANNPVVRDIGAAFTPGLGQMQLAGMVMDLPRQATKFGAYVPHRMAYSQAGQRSGMAKGLDEFGSAINKPRNAGKTGTDFMREQFGGTAMPRGEVTTKDILGNVGEMLGERSAKRANQQALNQMKNLNRKDYRRFDVGAKQNIMQGRASGGKTGEKIGESIEDMGRFGSGMANLAGQTFGLGGKALQGVGGTLQKAGQTLRKGGEIGEYIENPLLASYLGREYTKPELARMNFYTDPARRFPSEELWAINN